MKEINENEEEEKEKDKNMEEQNLENNINKFNIVVIHQEKKII